MMTKVKAASLLTTFAMMTVLMGLPAASATSGYTITSHTDQTSYAFGSVVTVTGVVSGGSLPVTVYIPFEYQTTVCMHTFRGYGCVNGWNILTQLSTTTDSSGNYKITYTLPSTAPSAETGPNWWTNTWFATGSTFYNSPVSYFTVS